MPRLTEALAAALEAGNQGLQRTIEEPGPQPSQFINRERARARLEPTRRFRGISRTRDFPKGLPLQVKGQARAEAPVSLVATAPRSRSSAE